MHERAVLIAAVKNSGCNAAAKDALLPRAMTWTILARPVGSDPGIFMRGCQWEHSESCPSPMESRLAEILEFRYRVAYGKLDA